MNTVERIKSICKERKLPISKLEKDLGFSNAYISQLKKGSVPDDRLILIAKYLNVSTTYLMTGKNDDSYYLEMAKTDIELSNMEDRLKAYALKLSKLSTEKQQQIMSLIDMLEDK